MKCRYTNASVDEKENSVRKVPVPVTLLCWEESGIPLSVSVTLKAMKTSDVFASREIWTLAHAPGFGIQRLRVPGPRPAEAQTHRP